MPKGEHFKNTASPTRILARMYAEILRIERFCSTDRQKQLCKFIDLAAVELRSTFNNKSEYPLPHDDNLTTDS